jgi:hypothetical protein
MLLRSWKRVVLAALAVVAVLGVNALARSARSGSTAYRSVPAAHRTAVSPAESVSSAHRAAAIANARQILGAVVLPTGSTTVGHAPACTGKPFSQKPFAQLFYQAQVDIHQFWVTSASESSVFSSIGSHLPAGSKSGGSAISSNDAESSYELPTVDPRVLGTRQLVVHLVPLSNGNTDVRLDAEVQYLAPWKLGQRIPAAAQFLQITQGRWDSSAPRVVRTITSHATVRRIATLIEALPFEGNDRGVSIACPNEPGFDPYDTFTFRAAADGPVLAKLVVAATASMYPDLCNDPLLTIRGHDDPPIAGGRQLLTEVDRLLGVRLTAR